MSGTKILIVEDDADLREALIGTLKIHGYSCDQASSAEEALECINLNNYEIIISDINLSKMNGLDLLKRIKVQSPATNTLLMTAYGDVSVAVQAMKLGAVDYLLKPFEAQNLIQLIKRFSNPYAMNDEYQEPIAIEKNSIEVLNLAKRVAISDSTVLISGESGTGKEVLARHIHHYSNRSEKSFIAINCAAIPENMLEATLFGYEKGAFTGAYNSMPGKFEQANNGTLLLDEISEMELSLQAKLLRVLQEQEVERLGGKKTISLNVRVIATTNRTLIDEVKQGRFREDLFYRLNVFPLQWFPLRRRTQDILPIARHLIGVHSAKMGKKGISLSSEAELSLLKYKWPGNVRELGNVIQRALILQQGEEIESNDLRLEDMNHLDSNYFLLDPNKNNNANFSIEEEEKEKAFISNNEINIDVDEASQEKNSRLGDDVRHHEYKLILETLRQENGHRKKTAEKLGISPRTLRYKIARMREEGINVQQGIGSICADI